MTTGDPTRLAGDPTASSGRPRNGEAFAEVPRIVHTDEAQDEPQKVQRSLIDYFEANVRKKRHERLYTWHGSAQCSEDIKWSYGDMAQRGRAVCHALRRRWGVSDGSRVMLIYPPGLDFLVAFFGCQYAAVIAVPYYPPMIPASPLPSASAKKMLADGLAKVVRIYDSCRPEILLSTTMCAAAIRRRGRCLLGARPTTGYLPRCAAGIACSTHSVHTRPAPAARARFARP